VAKNLATKQWIWDRAVDIAGVAMVVALWWQVARQYADLQALIERGM